MEIRRLHAWDLDPGAAVETQRALRERWERESPRAIAPERPRRLAGLDVGIAAGGDRLWGGVVVVARVGPGRWETIEEAWAVAPARFPYVPGLLSFREVPVLLAALERLRAQPEGLMVDGQGLAHPRRLGLACHLGLLTGRPTVGCAKSRLIGTHREPGPRRGARAALLDQGQRVGTVLRTREGARPLYVSAGFGLDRATAERWTLWAGGGFRLPEPTRRAHALVTRLRREAAP